MAQASMLWAFSAHTRAAPSWRMSLITFDQEPVGGSTSLQGSVAAAAARGTPGSAPVIQYQVNRHSASGKAACCCEVQSCNPIP